MYALLITDPDGTNYVYGPFTTESAGIKAQRIIDTYTDYATDTQLIPMTKYRRSDFVIITDVD